MKEIVARARDDSNLTVEMPNEPVLAKRAGTQLGGGDVFSGTRRERKESATMRRVKIWFLQFYMRLQYCVYLGFDWDR